MALESTVTASGTTTHSTGRRYRQGWGPAPGPAPCGGREQAQPAGHRVHQDLEPAAAAEVGQHVDQLVSGRALDPVHGIALAGHEEQAQRRQSGQQGPPGDDDGPPVLTAGPGDGHGDGVGADDQQGEEVGVGGQRRDQPVGDGPPGDRHLDQPDEQQGGQRHRAKAASE